MLPTRLRSGFMNPDLWRFNALLAICILTLSGCGAHAAGRPKRPQFVREMVKTQDKELIFTNLEASYESGDEATRLISRDSYVRKALRIYDFNYNNFLEAIGVQRKGLDAGTTITAVSLDAVSVLVTPASTKSILAALSAITTASQGAINKSYFYDQALPAIVKQMESGRQQVRADILAGLRKPTTQYSLDDAQRDLARYYEVGTIDGAISEIVQEASKSQTAAEERIREIRTNNEPFAQRLRCSIDVWLLEPDLEPDEVEKRNDSFRRVVGLRFGESNGENAVLWVQGASSEELSAVVRTLQIPVLSEEQCKQKMAEWFGDEIDVAERLVKQVKIGTDRLVGWIGENETRFEEARAVLVNWYKQDVQDDELARDVVIDMTSYEAKQLEISIPKTSDGEDTNKLTADNYVDFLNSLELNPNNRLLIAQIISQVVVNYYSENAFPTTPDEISAIREEVMQWLAGLSTEEAKSEAATWIRAEGVAIGLKSEMLDSTQDNFTPDQAIALINELDIENPNQRRMLVWLNLYANLTQDPIIRPAPFPEPIPNNDDSNPS